MSRRASFLKDRRGAAAIEFAVVAPLIFATAFGMFEAGRALYERNKLVAATAAGVRAAAIDGAEDEDAIRDAVKAKYALPERDRLEIDIEEETIGGAEFRRLVVTFEHETLIHFSDQFDGMSFTVTRFLPVI